MSRSWTYKSPDAIGTPKLHTYRGPFTRKEYHANKVLKAAFARASGPRRKGGGGGRKRRYRPRYRFKPKYGCPRR